jgi:HlyD family secretion protein
MKAMRRLVHGFVLCTLLLSASQTVWADEGIPAITIPDEDVALSFIHPGRIAKVFVKEGDLVEAGQILVQQDDAAEQAQLSLIKAQSEDRTPMKAQDASLAQKKVYLERLQWAAKRGSATELEVEDAKLAVEIARFSLKTARFEHEQHKRKYREASIRVDNMSLKSPIAGRVEKVDMKVGESIDGLAEMVRIVRTDPLWVDVHVPLEKASTLKLNQSANVFFQGSEQEVAEGKIVFVSSVADAASSTQRVRIKVPNKTNRPAGEHVTVVFLGS